MALEGAEAALVAACVAGDEAAWAELVTRHHPHVLRVARAWLERAGAPDVDALAEDVSAEVFSRLLVNGRRALASFEGRSTLATWLGVLTRRRAARVLARVERGAQLLVLACEEDARGPITPSEDASGKENARLVRAALHKLPERDRVALELFYTAGRTYKDVARALDLPEAHVSSLLARARKRLARELGA